MISKFVCLFTFFFFSSYGLVIEYDFTSGLRPYSYQTFSGIPMYSKEDSPSSHNSYVDEDGKSYIHLDLEIHRSIGQVDSELEIVIIPDTNINNIGIHKGRGVHLCCSDELIKDNVCTIKEKNHLIIPKNITGLYRYFVNFKNGSTVEKVSITDNVIVTSIHVFAMASCSENLGVVTFEGKSVWMNPYGHLPGDLYGYLPFYGWMCIAYLGIAFLWFFFNIIYWDELLYVQNCITAVLAMCLIEMAAWYFDYLHLNQKGIRHHGPFILGLILTITRRTISRMLVVVVSMGYGVAKPTLGPVKWKIFGLGIIYSIFAFMFEALIHYNQTEKVETWLRVILIPPVAILNGIFWWWTFVSLNHTIEYLKLKKQSAKLQLYKSFTIVLVFALIAAIGFAIYELYYVLKELYFAEWERLWFMEVGFWQLTFSVILIAIMILWRPSKHSKTYAYAEQLRAVDDENEDEDNNDDDDDDDDNNHDHLRHNKSDNVAFTSNNNNNNNHHHHHHRGRNVSTAGGDADNEDESDAEKHLDPKFVIDEDDDDDDHNVEKHPPVVSGGNVTTKID